MTGEEQILRISLGLDPDQPLVDVAKLKALKQKGASKNRLKRAKMKAKSAKEAVTKACSS